MKKIFMKDFSTNNKLILEKDAIKFYQYINTALKEDNELQLDFTSIDYGVTSFYNISICKFYKQYPELEKTVCIVNANSSDVHAFNCAMQNAKKYYNIPNKFI